MTAITNLIVRIEQIAAYYKDHDQEADYQDLRNVLDEYYKETGVETNGQ